MAEFMASFDAQTILDETGRIFISTARAASIWLSSSKYSGVLAFRIVIRVARMPAKLSGDIARSCSRSVGPTGNPSTAIVASRATISRSRTSLNQRAPKFSAPASALTATSSSRVTDAPQRLVLWDPIVYGTRYLDELVAANAAADAENYGARWFSEARHREMVTREATIAALGFPLGSTLRQQLRAISPNDFIDTRAAWITILNARTPEYLNELSRMLAARAVDISIRPVSSDIVWASNEAMNSAIVPADILQEVVAAFVKKDER